MGTYASWWVSHNFTVSFEVLGALFRTRVGCDSRARYYTCKGGGVENPVTPRVGQQREKCPATAQQMRLRNYRRRAPNRSFGARRVGIRWLGRLRLRCWCWCCRGCLAAPRSTSAASAASSTGSPPPPRPPLVGCVPAVSSITTSIVIRSPMVAVVALGAVATGGRFAVATFGVGRRARCRGDGVDGGARTWVAVDQQHLHAGHHGPQIRHLGAHGADSSPRDWSPEVLWRRRRLRPSGTPRWLWDVAAARPVERQRAVLNGAL